MPAGRGRGTGLSFSTESLGFSRGDVLPAAVLEPPPTYPPLTNKPVQLDPMAHFVNKDKDFRNYFRSSKFFLGSPNEPLAIPDAVNWEILPSELKPIHQKRKSRIKVKPNLVKKQKNVDWKEYEAKESAGKDGSQSDKDETRDDSEEEEERKSTDNVSEAEDPDDEMDGGTDYASNYFDNGEGYEDGEDDNLDEGGEY